MLFRSTEDSWSQFVEENGWIKDCLPNFSYGENNERCVVKFKFSLWKKVMRKMTCDFDERCYRKIQLKIMPQELREAGKRDDKKVIINDGMLKLHLNDRREEYNKKILNYKSILNF